MITLLIVIFSDCSIHFVYCEPGSCWYVQYDRWQYTSVLSTRFHDHHTLVYIVSQSHQTIKVVVTPTFIPIGLN